MSEWAWIGLAWGGLFFFWGILIRTGAIRAAFVRRYLYYPWHRRNALFAFIPIGLVFIAWGILPLLGVQLHSAFGWLSWRRWWSL